MSFDAQSTRLRRDDDVWDRAEGLIAELEGETKTLQFSDPDEFSDWIEQLARRLQTCCQSDTVRIRMLSSLIENAVEDFTQPESSVDIQTSARRAPSETDAKRCTTTAPILDKHTLCIDQTFPRSLTDERRRSIRETQQAIADLLIPVSLRFLLQQQSVEIGRAQEDTRRTAQLITALQGEGPLHRICVVLAEWFSCDRVCVVDPDQQRILATSSHRLIDRRSVEMRILAQAVSQGHSVDSIVHIDTIDIASGSDQKESAEIRVTYENFEKDGGSTATLREQVTVNHATIEQGIRTALKQDPIAAKPGRQRIVSTLKRRPLVTAIALVAVGMIALLPVPFRLRVRGTLHPSARQAVFATDQGIIEQVHVQEGDLVSVGTPLLRISSPQRSQLHEEILGRLATAQAKLSAFQSQRRASPGKEASRVEVVKAEIAGLQNQLKLLQSQRERLSILAPIDGRVRLWEQEISLLGRPVAHGQRLMTVIGEEGGHELSLEIPDHELGYLQEAHALVNPASEKTARVGEPPRNLRFHLSSFPGQTRVASNLRSESSAIKNSMGKTVVIAHCQVEPNHDSPLDLRSLHEHANVVAQIDCGKRSLGFVMFRKLIEWTRTSGVIPR